MIGLDVGTTRSTVSILDHTTGAVYVLAIKGAGAVVGVTYLPSEFVHYDGQEEFAAGMYYAKHYIKYCTHTYKGFTAQIATTAVDAKDYIRRPKTLRGSYRLNHSTKDVTTAIEAGLFGGAEVVDAADGLGFKTSKGNVIASITYEMYIVKILLDSVWEITGSLPKEVMIAVPGIYYC